MYKVWPVEVLGQESKYSVHWETKARTVNHLHGSAVLDTSVCFKEEFRGKHPGEYCQSPDQPSGQEALSCRKQSAFVIWFHFYFKSYIDFMNSLACV